MLKSLMVVTDKIFDDEQLIAKQPIKLVDHTVFRINIFRVL